jgi:hypothetical protein
MGMIRRFNDLAGLGWHGYWELLVLAILTWLAWHKHHYGAMDVKYAVYKILKAPLGFKRRVVEGVIGSLESRGLLEFICQSPVWRPGGWRKCPRDWRVTSEGYNWLSNKLSNLSLTIEDVLKQPSPHDVKNLVDNRIREIYKKHWERVRKYEEVAGRGI